MKLAVYTIFSELHVKEKLKSYEETFLKSINENLKDNELVITRDIDEFNKYDLGLVLVLSGGSENKFKEVYNKLKAPYYILSYFKNNSLAASLEIAAYVRNNNKEVEVLHGDATYISNRINEIVNLNNNKKEKYNSAFTATRYGVIGKPSDWLIASDVNYYEVKEKFNMTLVDIDIEEVIKDYEASSNEAVQEVEQEFDSLEIQKAEKLYRVLKNICVKHNLNGLTIRCFALLNTICTTACLALSKLNSEGYTCSCEGDIPSLISMHVANNLFKQAGFMCNPSQLDVSNNKILLAHCAIPLAMCTSYKFNTHFESNTGIGIKGELQEGDVTLFRINCKLDEVFISEGKILNNLSECDLCRTQVIVEGDNLSKLLTHTLGNHLILVYGKHRKELAEVLENLKFKQI